MRVMGQRRLGGLACVFMVLGGVAMAGTPPALYSAQQASAGATVYAHTCAMCHGADLHGGAGPALAGQSFAAPGSNTTLGDVFNVVAHQMPQIAPGSLSQSQDEDVMAYLLQKNGYPAGSEALAYKQSLTSDAPLVSQVK